MVTSSTYSSQTIHLLLFLLSVFFVPSTKSCHFLMFLKLIYDMHGLAYSIAPSSTVGYTENNGLTLLFCGFCLISDTSAVLGVP